MKEGNCDTMKGKEVRAQKGSSLSLFWASPYARPIRNGAVL